MGKALGITFGLLAALVVFVVYRTGYMKPVEIGSGFQGPFVMAYQLHKGPYHKIAPVIDGVEKTFKAANLPCPMAFGRYLHDPNTVEHDRLESHGGCLFPSRSPQLESIAKENGYTLEEIAKKEYLVAHFEGSPSVGPLKVYPKVMKWMEKYGYKSIPPVIEIYQTTGDDSLHTRYLFNYE